MKYNAIRILFAICLFVCLGNSISIYYLNETVMHQRAGLLGLGKLFGNYLELQLKECEETP